MASAFYKDFSVYLSMHANVLDSHGRWMLHNFSSQNSSMACRWKGWVNERSCITFGKRYGNGIQKHFVSFNITKKYIRKLLAYWWFDNKCYDTFFNVKLVRIKVNKNVDKFEKLQVSLIFLIIACW